MALSKSITFIGELCFRTIYHNPLNTVIMICYIARKVYKIRFANTNHTSNVTGSQMTTLQTPPYEQLSSDEAHINDLQTPLDDDNAASKIINHFSDIGTSSETELEETFVDDGQHHEYYDRRRSKRVSTSTVASNDNQGVGHPGTPGKPLAMPKVRRVLQFVAGDSGRHEQTAHQLSGHDAQECHSNNAVGEGFCQDEDVAEGRRRQTDDTDESSGQSASDGGPSARRHPEATSPAASPIKGRLHSPSPLDLSQPPVVAAEANKITITTTRTGSRGRAGSRGSRFTRSAVRMGTPPGQYNLGTPQRGYNAAPTVFPAATPAALPASPSVLRPGNAPPSAPAGAVAPCLSCAATNCRPSTAHGPATTAPASGHTHSTADATPTASVTDKNKLPVPHANTRYLAAEYSLVQNNLMPSYYKPARPAQDNRDHGLTLMVAASMLPGLPDSIRMEFTGNLTRKELTALVYDIEGLEKSAYQSLILGFDKLRVANPHPRTPPAT